MRFHHVNPILRSSDISRSLQYYTKVLGFEGKWDWGNPPDFGGVSKDGVEIFFALNSQGGPGTWLSLFVSNVDELYEIIKAKGARIISEPETMEWGVREMLVEDPDGHKIRFGHGSGGKHEKSIPEMPATIVINERKPTAEEYGALVLSVGWDFNNRFVDKILDAALFGVVAEDASSGTIAGCALVLGDEASFYYVKDVMVKPVYQSKQVGTQMMLALTKWIEENAPDNSLVGLYTGEILAPFYKQFGFQPAYGMQRRIKKK